MKLSILNVGTAPAGCSVIHFADRAQLSIRIRLPLRNIQLRAHTTRFAAGSYPSHIRDSTTIQETLGIAASGYVTSFRLFVASCPASQRPVPPPLLKGLCDFNMGRKKSTSQTNYLRASVFEFCFKATKPPDTYLIW